MRLGRYALLAAASLFPLAGVFAVEGRVAADNLVIDIGATVYRIPRLEAEGTALSKVEAARLFDAKDPASVDERLAKLAVARVTIPEIVGETRAGGTEQRLVYRGVTLEKIARGRIELMRADSLDQTGQKADGGRIEAHYGPMTVKGVDLRQIAHVLAKPRADDKEPLKPIEDEAVVESASFKLHDSKAEIKVGRLSASGVKARAFQEPLPQLLDRLAGRAASAETAAALDAAASVEVGALELRDVAVVGETGEPGKSFSVTLGRVSLTKLAGVAIDEAALENFALLAADGGKLSARRLSLRGVDARSALTGDGYPRVGHAEIADLDFDFPDAKAGAASRLKAHVAGMTQDAGDYRDDLPTKLSLRIDHAAVDLAARGETPATAQFLALGYRDVDLSARLDAEWREKTREIIVAPVTFDAKDMGALTLAVTFGGVAPAVFSKNADFAKLAALAMTLNLVDATVQNGELINRILEQEARRKGGRPPALRADYARDAGVAASSLLGDGEKARAIGAAVAKFVLNPKRLHIRLAAPKGVGALEGLVKKPADILNETEVEASAD